MQALLAFLEPHQAIGNVYILLKHNLNMAKFSVAGKPEALRGAAEKYFADIASHYDRVLPRRRDGESREHFLAHLSKRAFPKGTDLSNTPMTEPNLDGIRAAVAAREQKVKAVFGNPDNKLLYLLINPELYPMASLVLEYFNEAYGAAAIYLRDMTLSKEQKYLLHEDVAKRLGLECVPGFSIRIGVPSQLVVLRFQTSELFSARLQLRGMTPLSNGEKDMYNSVGLNSRGLPALFKSRFKGVLGDSTSGTIRGDLVYPIMNFIIEKEEKGGMDGLQYFDRMNYFRWAMNNIEGYNIHEVLSGIHIADNLQKMIYELSFLLNANDLAAIQKAQINYPPVQRSQHPTL